MSHLLLQISLWVTVFISIASQTHVQADDQVEITSDGPGECTDEQLALYQSKLIDIAFEAASAISIEPHIKSRSRAQEAVVVACFELDQPQCGLGYIKQIQNWRRGTGYADYAFYCARNECASQIDHALEYAERIACETEGWRRDRIKVKVAKVNAFIGKKKNSGRLEEDVIKSETGKVDQVRSMVLEKDDFAEQSKHLNQAIATGNFELTKNALNAYVQLFNRFYDDQSRRTKAEEKIMSSWGELPIMIRLELLGRLCGFALEHNDKTKSLELVNQMQRMIDENEWTAEYKVPLLAGVAELRYRVGETKTARTGVDDALALFEAEQEDIINIYRADALRPLAEAYQAIGDTDAALAVYKQAVEQGSVNPNLRPRAVDLSATCLSMALHNVEPDEQLWKQIHKIAEDLNRPW